MLRRHNLCVKHANVPTRPSGLILPESITPSDDGEVFSHVSRDLNGKGGKPRSGEEIHELIAERLLLVAADKNRFAIPKWKNGGWVAKKKKSSRMLAELPASGADLIVADPWAEFR